VEEIEALIGPVQRAGSSEGVALGSPGMLKHHYATRTPLYMAGTQPGDLDPNRTGHLVLSHVSREWENATVEVLSVSGDLVEAAANLFAAMRRLDEADLDAIVAHRVPDSGLGLAINDRITRAAMPSEDLRGGMSDELTPP